MSEQIGNTIKEQISFLFNLTKDKYQGLPPNYQNLIKYGAITAGVGVGGFSLYKFLTQKKDSKKSNVNEKTFANLKFLLKIAVPSFK